MPNFYKASKAVVFLLLSMTILACGSDSDDYDIRYVAIGASDATGIGAEPLSNGYVFRIEEGLEAATDKKVQLINLGIPGATSDIIEDIELPVAKEANPDLVTIFMGGNDINDGVSVEDFGNDVRSVVEGIVSDTRAIVVIANLPDLSRLPRFIESPDEDVTPERVRAYNKAISDIVVEFGIALVDLSGEPVEDYLVSDDGFHPNNQGYEKIANKFLETIVPLLGARVS